MKFRILFLLLSAFSVTYFSCTKEVLESELKGQWKVTSVSGTEEYKFDTLSSGNTLYSFDSSFTMSQMGIDTFGLSSMVFDFKSGGKGSMTVMNNNCNISWNVIVSGNKKNVEINPDVSKYIGDKHYDVVSGTIVSDSKNAQDWDARVIVRFKTPSNYVRLVSCHLLLHLEKL